MIDALNLSSQQAAKTEQEAESFLRQNGGRLQNPTMVYRLTDDGLAASEFPRPTETSWRRR